MRRNKLVVGGSHQIVSFLVTSRMSNPFYMCCVGPRHSSGGNSPGVGIGIGSSKSHRSRSTRETCHVVGGCGDFNAFTIVSGSSEDNVGGSRAG